MSYQVVLAVPGAIACLTGSSVAKKTGARAMRRADCGPAPIDIPNCICVGAVALWCTDTAHSVRPLYCTHCRLPCDHTAPSEATRLRRETPACNWLNERSDAPTSTIETRRPCTHTSWNLSLTKFLTAANHAHEAAHAGEGPTLCSDSGGPEQQRHQCTWKPGGRLDHF
jgi:hypothetical protein